MAWTNGNPTHVKTSTRNRILKRDHHQCTQCGNTEALEIDHIDNTRGFGYDEDYNLQTLCSDCHKTKTQHEAATARRARANRAKLPTRPHPGLL